MPTLLWHLLQGCCRTAGRQTGLVNLHHDCYGAIWLSTASKGMNAHLWRVYSQVLKQAVQHVGGRVEAGGHVSRSCRLHARNEV